MRYLIYLLVMLFYTNASMAKDQLAHNLTANNLEKENKQLSQKFRMATYLLTQTPIKERIASSDNKAAKELLTTAQSNFDLVHKRINEKNWLEAGAIIDSVIRDLTSASQLLSRKKINRKHYAENMRRVESFAMPVWSELSTDDQAHLIRQSENISSLVNRAKSLANDSKYAKANELLDEAYSLKTQLLKVLKHENTIVYDKLFDTPEEEFKYMLKRSQHYLDLVEGVMKENSFNLQTMKLIDTYVEQAKTGMLKAHNLENDNQHDQAILILDDSIKNLSSALKIMGIRL